MYWIIELHRIEYWWTTRWIIAVIVYSKDIWLRGLPEIISVNARLALRVYFHYVWDGLFRNSNTNFVRAGNRRLCRSFPVKWKFALSFIVGTHMINDSVSVRGNTDKILENLPKVIYNLLRFFCHFATYIHYLHVTKTKIFHKFYF